MITMIRPLPAGNAIRLNTGLMPGTLYTRILRRPSDAFTGPTDAGAYAVIDGFADDTLIDISPGLVNGVPAFYHAWDWNGSAWIDAGPSVSATPATSYTDGVLDPQELVRNRVQAGIAAEIAAGSLHPASGKIAVTVAPFALAEGISFPTISVHLESTGPAERALGDEITEYLDAPTGLWEDDEGWLARVSLTIAAVSLNADERISLRKALRRVIQANLPIFGDSGMVLIEFQQTDSEQFTENSAPIYVTSGAFSCLAPTFIRTTGTSLSDVVLTEITLDPRTGAPYASP